MCVCAQPVSCVRLIAAPSGPSVHGIFQARILEWVAISYCRRSSKPRDQTHISCVSCIGRQILYHQCRPETPEVWLHHFKSPNPSLSLFLLVSISFFFVSVTLFLLCKSVHLYHFLLVSTYRLYYAIFPFLFLTYFTLYDTLQVHPWLPTPLLDGFFSN